MESCFHHRTLSSLVAPCCVSFNILPYTALQLIENLAARQALYVSVFCAMIVSNAFLISCNASRHCQQHIYSAELIIDCLSADRRDQPFVGKKTLV